MSADEFGLSYGRGQLPLALPAEALATVIRKRPLLKLPDASAAISQAFAAPLGAAPLAEQPLASIADVLIDGMRRDTECKRDRERGLAAGRPDQAVALARAEPDWSAI